MAKSSSFALHQRPAFFGSQLSWRTSVTGVIIAPLSAASMGANSPYPKYAAAVLEAIVCCHNLDAVVPARVANWVIQEW